MPGSARRSAGRRSSCPTCRRRLVGPDPGITTGGAVGQGGGAQPRARSRAGGDHRRDATCSSKGRPAPRRARSCGPSPRTGASRSLFVEGNAELTPAKLVGHHNPARVLREDYSPDNFVPGPLVAAMQRGGFLYIEELNRAPDDTLNALLTAMAEREIEMPRGRAHPRRAELPDRGVDEPVRQRRHHPDQCQLLRPPVPPRHRLPVARGGRADRRAAHRERGRPPRRRRRGRSPAPRGITPTCARAAACAAPSTWWPSPIRWPPSAPGPTATPYAALLLDAAIVALSARITLDETSDRTPEDVIRELWEDQLILRPHRAAAGPNTADLPNPI